MMFQVRIQATSFDPMTEQRLLCTNQPNVGALVSFVGLTREFNAGLSIQGLYLEHYPGMTEKALTALMIEAKNRWQLLGIHIIHRIGELHPMDPIVLVAVAASHRKPAFCACEFLIDALKANVPLWKKEYTLQGERWLDGTAIKDACF